MEWIKALLDEFPEGRTLQKTGEVPRDKLVQFLTASLYQFNSPEFKAYLREGHQRRKNVEDLVNHMQSSLFESLGIQGSFGINFLAKVGQIYKHDAEVMKLFFECYSKEEMALDEAELPEAEFQKKYDQQLKLQEAVRMEMEKVQNLSVQDQQQHMQRFILSMMQSNGQPKLVEEDPKLLSGPAGLQTAGAALSEDEQLAFFQSLQNK